MILPRPVGELRAEERMRRALTLARTRTPPGDIPVAAVIYAPDGRELAWGTNRREADLDPTGHAEIIALRRAAACHGDGWRLSGCEIVVTLEPCAMCAGALVGARIATIIYGAAEPNTGACGSHLEVPRAPGALHVPEVRGGVLAGECADLLRDFFGDLRA